MKKLSNLQKEKDKVEAERFTNMDQFMSGNLEKDIYQKRRTEFTKEAERLDGLIADLEAKLHEAQIVQDDGVKEAVDAMCRYVGAEELDQKIVEELIEKVLVYDPEHVEIRWKFSDDVMEILK